MISTVNIKYISFLGSNPSAVCPNQPFGANPSHIFLSGWPETSLQALQGHDRCAGPDVASTKGTWMEPRNRGGCLSLLAGVWHLLQGDGRHLWHAESHSRKSSPQFGGWNDGHPSSHHSFPQAGGDGGSGSRLCSPGWPWGFPLCGWCHWWVPCQDRPTCGTTEEMLL